MLDENESQLGLESSAAGSKERARRAASKSSKSLSRTRSSVERSSQREESTLAESAEVNPRDALSERIEELQGQLKETEERYSALSDAVQELRGAFAAEREDCDAVLASARRAVQREAGGAEELRIRRAALAEKLVDLEAHLCKEDREGAERRAKEEERLNKSIVLIKTKLLILEGKRYERDSLLSKINAAKQEMAIKGEIFEQALNDAREKIKSKYEKLQASLHNRLESVSSGVLHLSRAQQVSAIRERQKVILQTQARYKKASQLMFRLHDRNKVLSEKLRYERQELDATTALATALAVEAQKAKQDLLSFVELYEERKRDNETIRDGRNLRTEFVSEIKDLENRVFEKKDHLRELEEILREQEEYKKSLDEDAARRAFLLDKLLSMSRVAQMLLGKAFANEAIDESEDQTNRPDFLEKMSTILLESADGTQEKDSFQIIEASERPPYAKGLLGLVPKEGMLSRRSSIRSDM